MAVADSEIQAGLAVKASTILALKDSISASQGKAGDTITNVTNNNTYVNAYSSFELTGSTTVYSQTEINSALVPRIAPEDVVVNELVILYPNIVTANNITATDSLVFSFQKFTTSWETIADSTFDSVPSVDTSTTQTFTYSTTVTRQIDQNGLYRLRLTNIGSTVTVPNCFVLFTLEGI